MKILIICSKKIYNKISVIKEKIDKRRMKVFLPNCYDESIMEEKM